MDSVVETVKKWYGIVPNFTRQEFQYFSKDSRIKPWRFFVLNATKEPFFNKVDFLILSIEHSSKAKIYEHMELMEHVIKGRYPELLADFNSNWIKEEIYQSVNFDHQLKIEELSKRFLSDGCFAPAAYYYTILKIFFFTSV